MTSSFGALNQPASCIKEDQQMSTTAVPDRFTTLPDENNLQATVVALEEHGFSVEVVGDLDTARQAVLARIPEGSSVMTNTSVTLAETGIADTINDGDGRWESARNKMFALDFATQAQEMKAIGGQPDYALGSVHAVTRDGMWLSPRRRAASWPPTPGARPT
jgi:LUD domain